MANKNHEFHANCPSVVRHKCFLRIGYFGFRFLFLWHLLHKNRSFPLRSCLVNVTRSAVSCKFGHIY